MSSFTTAEKSTRVINEVREVFSQVTRYPLEILEPNAGLEEDLGIDSVKLGEVFAVLREKYGLAEKLDISREQLRSIATISASLEEYISVEPPQSVPVQTAPKARAVAAAADIQTEVRAIFASVTRYPVEILEPDASLEEDLGIDSVKLGEVFAVLRERYELPETLDLPRELLKTIGGISAVLASHIAVQPKPVIEAHVNGTASVNGHVRHPENGVPAFNNGHAHTQDILTSVRQVFAEVTRYPMEILEPSSSLEEDLGIDSVKLGEVFAVLRERHHLPADLDVPREQLKTIAGIAAALRNHLGAGSPAPDVKAVVNGNGASHYSNGHHPAPAVGASVATAAAPKKPLADKIVFVSGSGRGLGKDIAVYLAEQGASVVVNSFHSRAQGIETVEEIKAAGGKAAHAWGSVANPEHLSSMFDVVEKTFGGLDFFVSNASNGMLARLDEITPEHWEKAFRTNVVGLHQSALRAVELMKKRGGGKIITLSSPASHGYVDYFGCMGAVKAAVESLTKSMAIEFAPYNIQVNCVSPGPIYGELLDKWPESKRLIAEWEEATVYDRLCEARDVSHFVAYLLQDAVKLFTGSVLVLDGGISVRWGLSSGSAKSNAAGA